MFERLYFHEVTLHLDTKSRLDVKFVKDIPLDMVIGQQIKEEGHNQNY